MLYACDEGWWDNYHPSFAGLKVTQSPRAIPGVLRVPSVDELGISLDPYRIHQGGNSGFQAMNLSVLLGATKILLVGFDMHKHQGRHWHDDHPPGMNNPENINFDSWRYSFEHSVDPLKQSGVEVINCNPDSALRCFPFGKLSEELSCVE